MSRENNIKLIKKLHHIWNTGEVDLIPSVYANDIIVHWAKGWGPASKAVSYTHLTLPTNREV